MNVEDYRAYCLSLGDDIEERMPFGAFKAGAGVLAFYVCGHMFSFFDIDHFTVINLKCQPDRIDALREQHPCITLPYNLSPKHWIGVQVDAPDGERATVAGDSLLRDLTLNSYNIVKQKYTPKPKSCKRCG